MGGMIAIVSKEWWPAIIDTERDSSSFGLMGRIKFKTDSVPIMAICAYEPNNSPGPYTIWSRLSSFLESSPECFTPRQFTETITSRWVNKARTNADGGLVVLTGDFNWVMEHKKS
jgi:hypothetical protein